MENVKYKWRISHKVSLQSQTDFLQVNQLEKWQPSGELLEKPYLATKQDMNTGLLF